MKKRFSIYGFPGLFFDADGKAGDTGGQTDWKTKYDELQAKINAGEYIAKASYVTLQQKLETAVNDRKAVEAARDEALGKVATLEKNAEGIQSKIGQLETETGKSKEELQKAQQTIERHSLIFGKFPELAQFEADGLLPQVPMDQLETKLASFKEKWFSNQAAAKQEFSKGAKDEIPPRKAESGRTPEAIRQDMYLASRSGKVAEYNALQAELQTALKTKPQ